MSENPPEGFAPSETLPTLRARAQEDDVRPPSEVPPSDDPGEPDHPAPRGTLLASAIAGTAAAVMVPLTEPGLGWFLAGTAMTAATVLIVALGQRDARAAPAGSTPWPDRAWRLAFGVAALALLAMGAARAATWLFLLCLLTAVGAGSLAVAGGRGWRVLGMATVVVPVTATRSWRWAWADAVRLPAMAPNAGRRLLQSTAVGVFLLLVFGTLLANADRAFADSLGTVMSSVSPSWRLARIALLFVLAAGLVLGAIRVAGLRPSDERGEPPSYAFRRLDWIPPLAMVDILFVWFVVMQFPVLFGNHAYVLDPDGPSYAEYARGGFGWLIVASMLTLAVIAVVARYVVRETRTDRVLLRVLAGALCVLTLVVLASAGRRLALYTEAYGFTRARLGLLAVGLLLALVFTFLLAAGIRLRAAWMPRATAAIVVMTVLGLAAVNPDAVVADTVIGRFEKDGHLDRAYLSELSVDAVDRLPEPERSCLLRDIVAGLDTGDPWYAYNAGRQRARTILSERPVGDTTDCPSR
ncbi:MAG: DUF4173 domain-containing protein [Dactylosporangium sp.]|nr:DUF4173 domain-containing protein [Dactylosporangium sp.]NNJ63826.1 DUF4173 domain-containing protein [Dactylosporangium sp.]